MAARCGQTSLPACAMDLYLDAYLVLRLGIAPLSFADRRNPAAALVRSIDSFRFSDVSCEVADRLGCQEKQPSVERYALVLAMAGLDPDDGSDRDLCRVSLLGQIHTLAGRHKRAFATRFFTPRTVLS